MTYEEMQSLRFKYAELDHSSNRNPEIERKLNFSFKDYYTLDTQFFQ